MFTKKREYVILISSIRNEVFLLRRNRLSLLFQLIFSIAVLVICCNIDINSIDISKISSKKYSLDSNFKNTLLMDTGASNIEVGSFNGDTVDVAILKDGKEFNVKVHAIDKTGPRFIDCIDEIELPVGKGSDSCILENFKAEDESGLLEYFILGNVDYNNIGEYYVRVACCDSSSNTTTTNLLVRIIY